MSSESNISGAIVLLLPRSSKFVSNFKEDTGRASSLNVPFQILHNMHNKIFHYFANTFTISNAGLYICYQLFLRPYFAIQREHILSQVYNNNCDIRSVSRLVFM
jgi:hypothetical protein